MTAYLVALTIVCQSIPEGSPAAPRWRTERPTTFPTGVVASRIPDRPAIVAHGDQAQAFVAQTFAAPQVGDDPISDQDEPFLVLVGPDDATRQIEQQIPPDIAAKIQVTRYEPEAPGAKRLNLKVGGRGVKALVMDAAGNVAYEGAFDLATVLDKLREILGIEPEDRPLLPNPFRPSIELGAWWLWMGLGALLTLGVQWALRLARLLWAAYSRLQADLTRLRNQDQGGGS